MEYIKHMQNWYRNKTITYYKKSKKTDEWYIIVTITYGETTHHHIRYGSFNIKNSGYSIADMVKCLELKKNYKSFIYIPTKGDLKRDIFCETLEMSIKK